MRDDLAHSLRLFRLLRILGHHDALFPLDTVQLSVPARWALRLAAGKPDPSFAALRPGQRLSAALQALGPSFIKLGQALSVRADLVGQEIAYDLGGLRDRLPPVPTTAARTIVESELGRPIASVFRVFDEQPAAAASIAQVHFAETLAGDPVAVKVLRPGIEAAFDRDLKLFHWLAVQAERRLPATRRLRPTSVVQTLAESVAQEMDLRMEAAAASELAEQLSGRRDFRLPRIYWDLTGRRLLTLERVEGIPLSERDALLAAGHDLPRLAVALIQVFLSQALEFGFFHADMHQGNLFAAPDGALVAVDFGIVGRLDRRTRLFMADLLRAFLVGDWRRAAEVHFAAGYVPPDRSLETFAQACRALGEPIRGRPVSEISVGRLLAQLFQVTELFGMPTQPHLLLLQKTMVTVEGVARSLDPEVNFWEAARPVVELWASAHLSPEARVRDTILDGLDSLARLPRLLRDLSERSEPLGPAVLYPRAEVPVLLKEARENRPDRLLPASIVLLAAAILIAAFFG